MLHTSWSIAGHALLKGGGGKIHFRVKGFLQMYPLQCNILPWLVPLPPKCLQSSQPSDSRYFLSSGSLWLSPPSPFPFGFFILNIWLVLSSLLLLCSNAHSAAIPQLASVCLLFLKTEKDKMKLSGISDPHLFLAQLDKY